jgi:hypothetical protein
VPYREIALYPLRILRRVVLRAIKSFEFKAIVPKAEYDAKAILVAIRDQQPDVRVEAITNVKHSRRYAGRDVNEDFLEDFGYPNLAPIRA